MNGTKNIWLAVGSVVGVLGSIAATAYAAPKIHDKIKDETLSIGRKLTWKEKIKLVWKDAAIPTVVGGATVACTVSNAIINDRRQAELLAGMLGYKTLYKNLKQKANEVTGIDVEQAIKDKIKEKREANSEKEDDECPFDEDRYDYGEDDKVVTFHDPITNTYFESTVNKVALAGARVNWLLGKNEAVSINEFYKRLGSSIRISKDEDIGWNVSMIFNLTCEYVIDIDWEMVRLDDGMEINELSYSVLPQRDYDL